MAIARTLPPDEATEEGLQRRLTSRQLTMIAIGSAIGVGLFLGSTVTIGLAGPGVIVTYLFGAVIALVMGYALAEMAVVHPQAGSFGVYAERYLSPWFGFVVRATYAFIQVLAIGAEVTAVAIYFAFWFPWCPMGMGDRRVAGPHCRQHRACRPLRRVRVLVRARQSRGDRRVHRRRPRSDSRLRAGAGDWRVESVQTAGRLSAARLGWGVAGADAGDHQLHGHRGDRRHRGRSRDIPKRQSRARCGRWC